MRDNPILLILVTVLGLSGLVAIKTPTTAKPEISPSSTEAKGTASGATSEASDDACEGDPVISVLCRYFGESKRSVAVTRFRAADSRVVIASVPDPLDSEVGFLFDQRLETLRKTAVSAGFTPDRFYLPWSATKGAAKETAPQSGLEARVIPIGRGGVTTLATISKSEPPAPPKHHTTPGAQLFRGAPPARGDPPESQPPLLLLLLVGETPSFGADPRVLDRTFKLALELATSVHNQIDGSPVLPVVGPEFSGAVPALRQAAISSQSQLAWSGYHLRFVSGSATSTKQLESLLVNCSLFTDASQVCDASCDPVDDVISFADPSDRMQAALTGFVQARAPKGARIVLLHEGDTSYGTALAPSRSAAKEVSFTYLPYPLHISQLWSAHLREDPSSNDPTGQIDAASRRSLSLVPEAPASPIDVPSSFFPTIATNTADRELSNLLQSASEQDPTFVGIVGSNVSDVIFLAHLVREQIPDAILFTYGNELLLTHPRHMRDLQGTWILSSFRPLVRSVQTQQPHDQTWLQFPSSWEVGVYYAFLQVLCDMGHGGEVLDDACRGETLRAPRWTARTGSDEGARLWLTAVGRGSLVSVDASSPFPRSETLPRDRGNVGAFALLPTALGGFALLILLSYCAGATRPVAHRRFLQCIHWAGRAHRNGKAVGLSLTGLLAGVFAAALYPAWIWQLFSKGSGNAWIWQLFSKGSGNRENWLVVGCLLVSFAVLLLAGLATLLEIASKPSSWPRKLVAAVPFVMAVAALVIAATVMPIAFLGPLPSTSLLLAQRAVDLTSGLSPIVPWSLLSAGLVFLAYAGLHRAHLVHAGSEELAASPTDNALDRITAFRLPGGAHDLSAAVELIRRTLNPRLRSGSPFALHPPVVTAVVVALFTTFLLWRHGVVSMEPESLNLIVGAVYVILISGAAYLGTAALVLWRQLRRLLRALAWGPLYDAFGRIPDALARTVSLRWSSRQSAASELRYDVNQLTMIYRLAPLIPQEDWNVRSLEIEFELTEIANRSTWTFGYQTRAQGTLSKCAGRLLQFLVLQWLEEPVANTWYGDLPVVEINRREGDKASDVLTSYRQRPVLLIRLAEEFVAVEVARFLGYAFAHLRTLLVSAIAVTLLAMLAAASYPFRPQHALLSWISLCFAVIMVITVTLLLQVERNEVVSRIANRSSGRIDFDAAFFGQVFTYLVLPIATLLVAQFPALSEPLSGLLGGLGSR